MPARREAFWSEAPLWLKAIVVAVAYFSAAELGNALSLNQQVSTFWPPAGVLLTLLVLARPREWPALLVAAASANVTSDLIHDRALAVSLGFVAANCLEASFGALMFRRLVGEPPHLGSRRSAVGFIATAALAPALGAVIGTSVLAAAFGVESWSRTWATWWSGDALGILAVGSLGLALAEMERRARRDIAVLSSPMRATAFVVLLVVGASVGWWLIATYGPLTGMNPVLFLPLLLTASTFGQFGAALTGFVITLAMSIGLDARWSAIGVAGSDALMEVIVLQVFLAVFMFAMIYVTASIEEAKTAEDAERIAAGKYRVLLETLPIGVSISDESRRIIETSEAAAVILGVSTAEHKARAAQGAEWTILREDGSSKPTEEWVSARALANNSRERAQEGVVRPDGSVVWLDVTAVPIPIPGYGEAITYQDVTEEVAARELLVVSERRLQEARGQLEAEVAERTAELQMTNAALLEALEAKGRFLASMSHELRTPLNAIIGFSDVMGKEMAGPVTEEQRRQLTMVNESGKHLLELVEDVLDVARIESGQESIESDTFNVCELVDYVFFEMEPAAHARGIGLRVDRPESALELCSDRSKVQQILHNLVSNAVKFTDVGEVAVGCRSDADGVLITVADTGIGIRADEMSLIMDDFHQVDRADGLKPPGTGLGLPISSRLAEMLGGSLDVESQPGRGSTFRVWLPNLPLAP